MPHATSGGQKRGLFAWLGTGVWAVTDQGLFAVSNFVLNLVLARWLGPSQYGEFALAYALFLLLGTFHTALVTQPLLVFGPGRFRSNRTRYLKIVAEGHWLLGVAIALSMLLAGLVIMGMGNVRMAGTLMICGAASPFVLFQWLARRACYLDLRPDRAALGGAFYMLLLLGGTFAMRALGILSTPSALGLMALASLMSASLLWFLFLTKQNRPEPSADDVTQGPPLSRLRAMRYHWTYGRWALGATLLAWVTGDVFYVVLTPLHGLEASGSLRAGMNLVMPALQGFSALAIVGVPALVAAHANGTFDSTFRTMGIVIVALGVVYSGLLLVFGAPMIGFVYGPDYASLSRLLPVLASLPAAAAIIAVLSSALRAVERPRSVFTANLASALVVATLGMALAWTWGTLGAASGIVLGSWVTAASLSWLVRRFMRDRKRNAPLGEP